MGQAADAPRVRLEGEAARRVAELWRRLPPGEPYRCHIPPFGLRFFAGDAVICQASVCWKCNNIVGDTGGRGLSHCFDGEASVSRELLSECRSAVGEPDA